MKDERFPKSKLVEFNYVSLPPKFFGKRRWKPLYTRIANASIIYFFTFKICWRMPWHPSAAYAEGWNACWRQMYSENEQLKTELIALKQSKTISPVPPDALKCRA